MDIETFERLESEVRTYCRSFPTVFSRANGACLYDEHNRTYVDFLCGAGALNYGHNPQRLKNSLINYIENNGVVQSLDMYTSAKRDFLETFERLILRPRNTSYRIQFTGPTGTNAVEAAFKLARKVTGRTTIAAFTNGFHGVSLGALAATASASKRSGAGVPLDHILRLPFEGAFGSGIDTAEIARMLFENPSSGYDKPAAFIIETVQGEGGINVASAKWLQSIVTLARSLGSLVIIDDIQAGCGRTGTFFSFDEMDIQPDIVCLSKSISGYGLPMSIVLLNPMYDCWEPGEHNGTFRGHNLAFVTAAAALSYWSEEQFLNRLGQNIALLESKLNQISRSFPSGFCEVRGRGMLRGIYFSDRTLAAAIATAAFDNGLIVETCGPHGQVLKIMPALNIEQAELDAGLSALEASIVAVIKDRDDMIQAA